MSLLISNPTPFAGSAEQSSGKYIGFVDGVSRYLRYSLNFSSSDLPYGAIGIVFSAPVNIDGYVSVAMNTHYGIAINTSSTPDSAYYNSGSSQNGSLSVVYNSSSDNYTLNGNAQYTIYPNTQYYLWLYPIFVNGWALVSPYNTNYNPTDTISLGSSGNITYHVYLSPGSNSSGSTYDLVKTYSLAVQLWGVTYSRTGYSQVGWSYNSNGSSWDYNLGANYIINSSTTLYPYWTPNTFTVTYDGNGSTSGSMSVSTFTYGVASQLTANAFTKTGYSFSNWLYSGNAYSNGATVTNLLTSGNATFVAQWSVNSYTVTYNGNGGSSPSTYTGTYGSSVTLPTSNRVGYIFNGWYTASSGGTLVTSYTIPAYNSTLYAQWTPITYYIAYNNNGGSGSMTRTTCTYGSSVSLTINTFTRSNYNFSGWSTSSVGSVQYLDGQAVSNLSATSGAEVVLYAVWVGATYVVSFDSTVSGVNPSVGSKNVTYGSTYGDLATCFRSGYTLDGWYTASSGGTKIDSSTTVEITSAQTLYAHWTANQYTIIFNPGTNGSVSTTSKIVTYNSTYGTLPTPTNLVSTKAFRGWYLESSYANQITSSTTVTITSNQSVYAKWVDRIPYTMTFTGTTGSEGETFTRVKYSEEAFILPATASFSKEDYLQDGWTLDSSGAGTELAFSSSYTTDADTTFYPYWVLDPNYRDGKISFYISSTWTKGTPFIYSNNMWNRGWTYLCLPTEYPDSPWTLTDATQS